MGRKRTLGVVGLLSAFVLTSCGAPEASAPPPTTKSAAIAPPTTAEILTTLMPIVVLLIATHEDGSVGFGSAFIVSGDGLVVTNHHVIAGATKIGAMLYDPARPSYTPMDGGLTRYLFENAKAIVPAAVERDDPTGDLAIVRIKADTSKAPLFRAARAEPKLGERVIALGHPQEGLWSYTAGEVSGLRSAMIQHDALIGGGSSGGPLVNANGEVVGINTAVITNESRGLSFARPISMAIALLDSSEKPLVVDASTPERAALTGWRLSDLGSAGGIDLLDWDNKWRTRRVAVADFEASRLEPIEAKALAMRLDAPGGREAWITESRVASIESIRDPRASCDTLKESGVKASARAQPIVEEARSYELAQRRATSRFTNLRVNLFDNCDTASFHAAMRLGLRVDRSKEVAPDLAWVVLAGRNPDRDRTPFTFAELYIRDGARWVQREYPSKEEIALLPVGWPPPLETFERERRHHFALLVARYVK